MKVFCVAGYHHTGKTSMTVALLRELRKRGFSVSSIKDIHNEQFTMEKPGSNSWRHWEASQSTVIARGLTETYQIWHEQLNLIQMLSHLDSEYVIVEGMKSAALPKVICAESEEQLEELVDGRTIAIAGKYSDNHDSYKHLMCYNHAKDAAALADLVIEKVFEVLPQAEPECCSNCGLNCHEMVSAILSGEKTRDDCKTDRNEDIEVLINGKKLNIVPYVQNTFKDVVVAFLLNLKGVTKDSDIEIKIRQK